MLTDHTYFGAYLFRYRYWVHALRVEPARENAQIAAGQLYASLLKKMPILLHETLHHDDMRVFSEADSLYAKACSLTILAKPARLENHGCDSYMHSDRERLLCWQCLLTVHITMNELPAFKY